MFELLLMLYLHDLFKKFPSENVFLNVLEEHKNIL